MHIRALPTAAIALAALAPSVHAGFTRNILITGYWPPTNEMVRQWSTNPAQNPGGWQGGNWEGRGYNIHSYFPEFPGGGLGKGVGDLEVDYQDTTADFARITDELKPLAIITFSRGNVGRSWELEYRSRNLAEWEPDYQAPFQPDSSPPDPTLPAGAIRYSSLPMLQIVDAVRTSGVAVNPFIDFSSSSFGGGFLSEYIAYQGKWYKDRHSSPDDDYRTFAAGHIHVGTQVSIDVGRAATEVTLRELTRFLDTVIPAPGTAPVMLAGCALITRRRRS